MISTRPITNCFFHASKNIGWCSQSTKPNYFVNNKTCLGSHSSGCASCISEVTYTRYMVTYCCGWCVCTMTWEVSCRKKFDFLFLRSWFSDPNQTIRSDRDNRKPLTNTVLLTTRIVLCTKSTKPFEPQLNRPNLRTVNGSHSSDQRLKKKKKITSS